VPELGWDQPSDEEITREMFSSPDLKKIADWSKCWSNFQRQEMTIDLINGKTVTSHEPRATSHDKNQ